MVMSKSEEARTLIREDEWNVKRLGRLEEVVLEGGSIRFRVKIWDAGREAFITQWFNDVVPAADFLERVKEENQSWMKEDQG